MIDIIQMRNGERINSRELKVLEMPWARVGARLDALTAEVDAMAEEPCS